MINIPKSTSGRSAIDIAKTASIEAGRVLMERFKTDKEITFKGRGNIVTDVDNLVQEQLRDLLYAEFPNVNFLGEESPTIRADDGYVWIVDPLDGTRNYASGIPFFSTVVGLACNGDILLGVNYDPVRKELFWSEKGGGAFLNDDLISVSTNTTIQECVLGFDMGYVNVGGLDSLKTIASLWPEMQSARIMGSAALGMSYAAAGRIDIYFHRGLAPWDMVAGLLLVREAGGVVTNRNGGPAGLYGDGLIATNTTLHSEFLKKTDSLEWPA